MNRCVVWDFDGTLAYRQGGNWTAAVLALLRRADPACALTEDDVRPHMVAPYFWSTPEVPHPHLRDADTWWEAQAQRLVPSLVALGYAPEAALDIARQVRGAYAQPAAFRLFDDTLPTLAALSQRGWRHVLLSNHVPELRAIAAHLGLMPHLHAFYNSAETGYEKPHPRALGLVLEDLGATGDAAREALWVVGDSPTADLAGAQAAGLPCILVRRPYDGTAVPFCADLSGVPALLGA